MDILAHGLWTAAAYTVANKKRVQKKQKRLHVLWATFWGVFPDLFAFTLPWILILFGLATKTINPATIPGPDSVEPPLPHSFPAGIFNLASSLYNISHSAVVFGATILCVWIVTRKIYWEMGGWLLHILIDIPTHAYSFFPTPVFWPISGWKFSHGISWGTPWFMAINYSLLAITYISLFIYPQLKSKTSKKDGKVIQ